MKELRWAMATFRLAMGVTFLSPVADRFGLWGPPGTANVSWGNWDRFVAYSTRLNWYLPDALQQSMAALAMATGLGIRAPLDYSVFVDAAGAWLLAAAISCDRRMAVGEFARPAAADARTD